MRRTTGSARFGEDNGIEHSVLIPNGADMDEFSIASDPDFRRGLSIPASAVLILTVGTLTRARATLNWHKPLAPGKLQGRDAVLILNGNIPEFGGRQRQLHL